MTMMMLFVRWVLENVEYVGVNSFDHAIGPTAEQQNQMAMTALVCHKLNTYTQLAVAHTDYLFTFTRHTIPQ